MKKITFITFTVLLLLTSSSCTKKEHNLFATLHGVVSDRETGEPIAIASVNLSPGGKTLTTGTDGRYQFDDLDPQQYTITVQKLGYQTDRKTITAIVGESAEASFRLTKSE